MLRYTFLLLIFIFTSLIGMARPYAVVSSVTTHNDCITVYIDIYDDMNNTDPSDDQYMFSGVATNCRGAQDDLPDYFNFEKIERPSDDIPEARIEESLMIYPNPSSDLVQINLEGINAKVGHVSSLSGKLIKQFSLSNDMLNFQLEIDDLSPGVYLINIYDGEIVRNSKLVVE